MTVLGLLSTIISGNLGVLAIAVTLVFLLSWMLRPSARLPPGPKPLPLIGNIHELKGQNAVHTFQKWHKLYGPIISVKLGPKTMISVGSHQVARDLFTQRSHIYSSRPRFPIMDESLFRGLSTVLLPYGPRWRSHQRLQWHFLRANVAQTYRPAQDVESKQLLHELLSTNDFKPLFLRLPYSLNSTLAYGKRIATKDGNTIKVMANVSKDVAAITSSAGGSLVEMIPALNMLPSWLAPWKKSGARAFDRINKLYESNRAAGEASPSWNWMKGAVGAKEAQDIPHEELSHIIGFIFEVGGEVVCGVLEVFILAAVTFPEVMEKARQEIETVVGTDRLPGFDDLPNLPYTCAVVTESLRWRTIAPLGFPHMNTQDDEYNGYRIPKGTTILPNHWAMDMDEEVFECPSEFRPERWLENPDLPIAAYGFGRRSCAGRHVGQDTVRIVVARLLWAFDITPKGDVDPMEMVPGLLSPPKHFSVQFKIRTRGQEDIIEREWADVEKDPHVFMKTFGPSSS
ncbi:hypothetical protein N7449_008979 [Penicillium cf. viridicatum]|uniref:Cytochrome P450 n=1 Tax=Penicillium cf. viridicatum TaxID=2972119 RepID=A0A9W9JB39_9EURO|nr:hypothetical protein N7449_008979 [Penicillium cf. viridicatum]